ncbi:MAG: DUF6456 domain-containing protein [Alphaproteobacteria bacterium]|nr:DUF6456 domain-containing protein [Alphaproteobacteria bacterium]
MSERRIGRALARLAASDAVLRLDGAGPDYGVFTKSDRRRRALLRLHADEVRSLEADGVIERHEDEALVLSPAGLARVARENAAPGEAFVTQHLAIVSRDVVDSDGALRKVRGVDSEAPMRRLAALRGLKGEPWLSQAELSAAGKLRSDWSVGELGLVRGSDWLAPPMGTTRGPGNAQESAMARRCDARRRLADALARLADPLRRVVERVCLYEEGLETLERSEGWPARSAKLALKLGLAQLAADF